jgi:alkyl sulfatase BDS1-like metallo-beta-lactamase superfamily hydrolase
VYQAYLGFYDANPATLDPLPRTESAKKYVEAMGGEEAVIEAGRKAFEAGDYRWVVELVNNAVFANPDNAQARALQADALEQLGYQAESATWRNAYLMGAQELRDGIQPEERSTSNPDTMAGMTNEMLFDFISVSLDQEKTDGMQTAAQVTFTDLDETWALELENSVLNNTKGRKLANPDVTLTLTRPAFLAMVLGGQDVTELVQSGQITMKGDPTVFAAMLGSAVQFNPAFNVVTPPTGP